MKRATIFLVFSLWFWFLVFGFWSNIAFASDYTSPLLRIFNGKTQKLQSQFLTFDKLFRGGGYVTAGDILGKKDKEIIVGTGYGVKPQIRIFNKSGRELVPNPLEYYEYSNAKGLGVRLTTGDINGDKRKEIIYSSAKEEDSLTWSFVKGIIHPIPNKQSISSVGFEVYDDKFTIKELNIASCDINRNGIDDYITAPASAGPQVRIFNGALGPNFSINLGLDFFAYEKDFRGGVSVACGDVNGDGRPEIVVGPQSGRKAEIEVFKVYKIHKVYKVKKDITFLAFPENFTGGVNLAAGDTNGDGKKEILVAVAGKGGPQVKIFNQKGKLLSHFFAYEKEFRGGVRLTAANLDKKKGDEIIVMPGAVLGPKKCEKNCVALTFDDGYGAADSFPRILDILKARRVHATFFILGKAMQAYPDLMRRIVLEGNQLANHGYSHGYFPGISETQIRSEIEFTDQIAFSITDKHTKPYFRYPYGAHNARTDTIVASLGYKYFMWTGSTGDTAPNRSAQNSLYGALYGLRDGSIILAHTQSPHTASALDQIITAIQRAGYNLVTIAEMP
ncbi:MAG: polysaccharide deacetylase family protein [Patescibacteria group bacterium]